MKVILKATYLTLTNDQLCSFRQRVIKELNTDGVAIVPSWCDVFVLDDKEGEIICQ